MPVYDCNPCPKRRRITIYSTVPCPMSLELTSRRQYLCSPAPPGRALCPAEARPRTALALSEPWVARVVARAGPPRLREAAAPASSPCRNGEDCNR
jgi:hypothetical protein